MPAQRKQGADTTIGPVFQVRDLTGGVNLRPSPTVIKPEQARRLLNTLISSNGELGVYPGFRQFLQAAAFGSRRFQGGKRIYLAGAIFTLLADLGQVFRPDDAGVMGSAQLSSLHTSNAIDFVYDRDIVAVFDSATVPQKSSDGDVWTQLGISPPLVAPSLSAVNGGALVNGDTYEIAYAYGNTLLNQIGNISATATQAVSAANLIVRVAVTASLDPQVNQILIFARDTTAGETVLRLYGSFPNTTASRDVTANVWSGEDEAPINHDVALPMAFGVVWKNRWWGRDAVVGNRLRFSQIFANMSWPSTFFVDIPFERGEAITALIPLGDVLVVFGYTKFYLIIGQTSLDFEVRPSLGGQTGAFGFHAADVLENGVVHAGNPGVYLFNGASDELLSYTIDPAWRAFIGGTAASILAQVPIVYHKLVKELRVGVSNLYPTGTFGEWILDLNRTNAQDAQGNTSGPAWFATDRSIGGYIQWDGNEPAAGNQGRIFSWSPSFPTMYEERVGTTADGSNRTMEYAGFMLPFGLQMARLIDTYIEHQPALGTLTVDLQIDGKKLGAQSFTLLTNITRWGEFVWGVDRWSGGVDRTTLPVMWPLTSEGRAAQLILKYTGKGDFKVFTYGHNVFAEPVPRGL